VERSITGFHLDEQRDWVAELSCGHDQHVRHRPPFQIRPWVVESAGRTQRIGTSIQCPPCDRAELPDGLRLIRSSPEWDERTVPAGLLRSHRVAGGVWGRVVVRDGQLRFTTSTEPRLNVIVGPGEPQAIPPDVGHSMSPLGPVRFSVDFLAVDRHAPGDLDLGVDEVSEGRNVDEGGDPACWAELLCPECGAVLESGVHP